MAAVSPSNTASIALVTKLGFRRVRVQTTDGGADEYVFEIAL